METPSESETQKNTIKFLSSLKSGQALKNVYLLGKYPDTDWRRIFILFLICSLGIIVSGFYIYFSVKSTLLADEVEQGVQNSLILKEAEGELVRIIDFYEHKKTEHNLLINSFIKQIKIEASSTSATSTGVSNVAPTSSRATATKKSVDNN